MRVSRRPFGSVDGRAVSLFTLAGGGGLVARVTDYGAILTELHVPDRQGRTADVVLGFETLEPYRSGHPYFGCIVGRVANRIARGRFVLDGRPYVVAANDGDHHLHGGVRGFDKQVWDAEALETPAGASVTLTRTSPDGEEGYPGSLAATVTYTVTHDGAFRVEMVATADAPTIVNLAHHAYWNLAGHASGDVLGHELTLCADRYTPVDAALVPTGAIAPVAGTPFDFTRPKRIGADLARLGGAPGGYDVNFVLNGEAGVLRPAARVTEPTSGRSMALLTTEPGVQFYTGNFLDGSLRGKGGAAYRRHQGFCLETQRYPDSIHHPEWPTVVLRPGETYRHVMVHQFDARER
jgi:aldose 1-epimerase